MTNFIDNYSTDLKNQFVSDEAFLGSLVWYSVTDVAQISHDDYVNAVTGTVVEDTIPCKPVSADIFKRACTAAQLKKVPAPNGEHYNFLVRNVGTNKDGIYREIVVETIDPEGHEIAFAELCTVIFDRDDDSIRVQNRANMLYADEQVTQTAYAMVDSIRAYCDENINVLTPLKLREIIRTTFENTMASIKVRKSGGIYYVNSAYDERLQVFESVINSLPGCNIHTVPLLDSTNQREMVRAAFEVESVGEVDSLMTEMREILNSGKKITIDRAKGYHARYSELVSRLAEYSDTLEMSLENTAMRLEMMQTQCIELIANGTKDVE